MYTKYKDLNSILKKVLINNFKSITNIIYLQNKFNLKELYEEHPECRKNIGSKGKERRLTTSILKILDIFQNSAFDNSVTILGLINNRRCYKHLKRIYLESHPNLDKYKVILPKVNGTGAFDEIWSSPIIGEPGMGFTQSFISIGAVDSQHEVNAIMKYIKSKFVRAILHILKVTQDNNSGVWKYVPLQDFTANSDIDWSKPIHDIDLQLYKKYDLSDKEIKFIETHVKEMA